MKVSKGKGSGSHGLASATRLALAPLGKSRKSETTAHFPRPPRQPKSFSDTYPVSDRVASDIAPAESLEAPTDTAAMPPVPPAPPSPDEPASASDSSSAVFAAPPPAPMPARAPTPTNLRTRHARAISDGQLPAPAPAPAPAPSPAESPAPPPAAPVPAKSATDAGLDGLPDLRESTGERPATHGSTTHIRFERPTQLRRPESLVPAPMPAPAPPSDTAESDDEFEPPSNRSTFNLKRPSTPAVTAPPAMPGTEPPSVKLVDADDELDSFAGVEAAKSADSGVDEDDPLFDFSELGLVDVAAVDAEVAAERAAADTFFDLEAITDEPEIELEDDDDDSDDDFDEDAFSAALSQALTPEPGAKESPAPEAAPPADPQKLRAQTADLLAAIAEVEKAFETRKKSGDWDEAPAASMLVRDDEGFHGDVGAISATADTFGTRGFSGTERAVILPPSTKKPTQDDSGGFTLEDLARGAASLDAQKSADADAEESAGFTLEDLARGAGTEHTGTDTSFHRIVEFDPDAEVQPTADAFPAGSDVELEASQPVTPPTQPPFGFAASTASTASTDEAMVEAGRRALDSITGGPQRYEMQGELAAGGMGEVHRVRDSDLRRIVAMKIIKRDAHRNPAYIARFVEEAQINGQLEHPNIVPVHELGVRRDGRVFFTQKLVNGYSLANVLAGVRKLVEKDGKFAPLRRKGSAILPPAGSASDSGELVPANGPNGAGTVNGRKKRRPDLLKLSTDALDLSWMLMVFLKVCDAVAFAHSRGVVHRDLKPANIMIGDFGEVLVVDWDCAKVLNGPAHGAPESPIDTTVTSFRSDAGAHTIEGAIRGTPQYMPPEQAQGLVDELDERSDVYSLGATLYEMLALRRPYDQLFEQNSDGMGFAEASVNLLQRIVVEPPIPPRDRSPDRQIPRELEAVVQRAMAKAPAARYQSVGEMTRDIRLFISGHTLSAVDYTPTQRLAKFVSRNPVLAAASILILAALIVGAFLARDFSVRQNLQQAQNFIDDGEKMAATGDYAGAAAAYWQAFGIEPPADDSPALARYEALRQFAERQRLDAQRHAELNTDKQAAIAAATAVRSRPAGDTHAAFVADYLDALARLQPVIDADATDAATRELAGEIARELGAKALAAADFAVASWAFDRAATFAPTPAEQAALRARVDAHREQLAAEMRQRIGKIFDSVRTDESPASMQRAWAQLTAWRGPLAVAQVAARITDRSPAVRRLALDVLPHIDDSPDARQARQFLPRLVEILENSAEPLAVRIAAASAISHLGDASHAAVLWRVMRGLGPFADVFAATRDAYRRLDGPLNFGFAPTSAEARYWKRVFHGIDRLQAKDPLAALGLLSQACTEAPTAINAADAHVWLAYAQILLGQSAAAFGNLRTAVAKNADNLPAHLLLARLHRERHEVGLAVKELGEADRIDSADVRNFIERAAIYLQLSEFADAEQFATRGLKFEPGMPDLLAIRAMARAAQGNRDDALRDIDTALDAVPNRLDWRLSRADWLVQQNQLDQAEREWARILTHDARYGPAFAARGAFYLAARDFARALADLKQAVVLVPENLAARRHLAECHIAMQNFPHALDALRAALPLATSVDDRAAIEQRIAEVSAMRRE